MNYSRGMPLLLFAVLLIGFVVNFFEKRVKDYYIFASYLQELFMARKSNDWVYLPRLCHLSIFSSYTEYRSVECNL